jgi:uncharacterized OB-fold protein
LINGSECRCGFKTISIRPSCPICGKMMEQKEFSNEGKVLSYTRLQVPPEGFDTPLDIVMVEIDKGPKLICWTESELAIDQRVEVYSDQNMFKCRPVS